jgi:hypothetical protein
MALYGVYASYPLRLNCAYYRGMVAADPCAELQRLKRQYESALRVWGLFEFPPHNQPTGTRVRRFEQLQLKQLALDARNAANHRVLNHKRICPLCSFVSATPDTTTAGMSPMGIPAPAVETKTPARVRTP